MRDSWSRAPGRARSGGGAARRSARILLCSGLLAGVLLLVTGPAEAFRVIGTSEGWMRWDASPRYVGGEERSLAGGLRYSIEHGDYALLRDEFLWVGTPPSPQAFAAAIRRAFDHWEAIDPATGLSAGFYFVEDLGTVAIDQPPADPNDPNSYLGLNAGAEIDLFAETPHIGPGFGASVIFFVDTVGADLTLSSGRPGYAGLAMSGADIRMNTAFVWTLSAWETLLTHEIGHALGLADLETSPATSLVSGFLDDDYDPTSSATALATLTNVSALAIDPFDPDASPLLSYAGNLDADPGIDTLGAALLMESEGWVDLIFVQPKLQNDDVAGRQFLYPVPLPEPGTGLMLFVGVVTLLALAGTRASSPARTRR